MTRQLPTSLLQHPLHRLLDASLALAPEYADELTNHLPMALHALAELGADEAQLQAFFDVYARRFEAREVPPPAAPLADWTQALGQIEAFSALRAGFEQALARDGLDAVLRQVLPRLWPGLAAAAFHGPIRVAHAVQTGHTGEIAAALAYWAARWQALEAPQSGAEPIAFDAWSVELQATAGAWRSEAGLISLRMADSVSSASYQGLAEALAPPSGLAQRLAQLSGLALQTYAGTRNFTVLHMVTGLRAVRELAPWLAGSEVSLAVLDRAFTAAWLAARLAPAPVQATAEVPDQGRWPAVLAAALASTDDHVIKLVHACRSQAGLLDPALCLRAALAATRLDD